MAWIAPRTNWMPADGVSDSDMKRIEGNIKHVHDNVGDFTVKSNVPAGAKFTDTNTVYAHPSTHPASMIVEAANKRFMTDAERTKLTGIATGANKYTHPATHPATILSGGTLPAGVLATNSTDYTTSRLRNIRFNTTVPTSLANGELYFMYE